MFVMSAKIVFADKINKNNKKPKHVDIGSD